MVRFPGVWEKGLNKGKGGIEPISTRGTLVVVLVAGLDAPKDDSTRVILRVIVREEKLESPHIKRPLKISVA